MQDRAENTGNGEKVYIVRYIYQRRKRQSVSKGVKETDNMEKEAEDALRKCKQHIRILFHRSMNRRWRRKPER